MSSALTDSTIWSAFFFLLTALCSEARKPVTTISFSSAGAGAAVGAGAAWAIAGLASIRPITNGLAVVANSTREKFLVILPLHGPVRAKSTP